MPIENQTVHMSLDECAGSMDLMNGWPALSENPRHARFPLFKMAFGMKRTHINMRKLCILTPPLAVYFLNLILILIRLKCRVSEGNRYLTHGHAPVQDNDRLLCSNFHPIAAFYERISEKENRNLNASFLLRSSNGMG